MEPDDPALHLRNDLLLPARPYLTGLTIPPNFPATVGAFDGLPAARKEAAIAGRGGVANWIAVAGGSVRGPTNSTL